MPDETIFIALAHALQARNFLLSQTYATLCESGARIVFFLPGGEAGLPPEVPRSPQVKVEVLWPYVPGPWESRFHAVRYQASAEMTESMRMRADMVWPRSMMGRVVASAARFFSRRVGPVRCQRAFARIQQRFFATSPYAALFDLYKPQLVVLGRIFHASADYRLLLEARKQGVPTALTLGSWDNLTCKGLLPAPVDHLLAWSDRSREEAITLHGVAPERVAVTGAPQFDGYFEQDDLPDREAFFKRFELDPERALITICLATPRMFPRNLDIVDAVWDAVRSNRLRRPAQILVRHHPVEPFDLPRHYHEASELRVSLPGAEGPYVDRLWSSMDVDMLGATMKYSDVVINQFSTTCLDAAAFDTPVICPAYDGHQEQPFARSMRRYQGYRHVRQMLDTGGVRVVHNDAMLLEQIDLYLEDATLDGTARRKMFETFCGPTDGLSGQRVAETILRICGGPQSEPFVPGSKPEDEVIA